MKKTLRAVGAAGLAAATIVTGLSFGPAATAATTTEQSEYKHFKLISRESDGNFRYKPIEGDTAAASTIEEARSKAPEISAYPVGTDSNGNKLFTLRYRANSVCLGNHTVLFDQNVRDAEWSNCNENALWFMDQDGYLRQGAYYLSSTPYSYTYQGRVHQTYPMTKSKPTSNTFVDFPSSLENLSAEVSERDTDAGRATVSGSTPADATSVRIKWTNEAGQPKQRIESVKDGKYSAIIDGLKLGTTTVEVSALEGSEVIATTTVDVKLEVAPITATATFEDNVHAVVQASGTAQPNTDVTVKHGLNAVGTVKSDAEGKWSMPLNAPNMPGEYDLTVSQKIRGVDTGQVDLVIDYGAGVVITTPADDLTLDPGESLAIGGNAPAGTEVVVHEKGKSEILATTTAGKNNSWLTLVDGLEDREYSLVAEGVTKGNNHTHSDVKINPGKSSVEPPVGEATFSADVTKKATIKGSGASGATITVKNGSKTLGSTKVGDDGKWSLAIDPIGPGKHTLTLEQTGIEGTQTAETEIDYGAAVGITDPAAGTVAPGQVHVSGTGADGAAVRVQAGGETATATVVDGTWSTDIEIPAAKDATEINVTQQSKGALTTTATVSVTPNGSQQLQPVVITDPASGTYSNDGKAVEVGGTATPYATVTVKSQWNTLKTVTADRNGKWSFWRGFGPNVPYNLTATQTTVAGQTSESVVFTLNPEGGDVNAPVVITEPADGHYASSGATQVKGTAAANATVEVRADWGVLATVKADAMGNWSFWRGFGPTVTYHLVAKQTKVDGTTSESAVFELSPEGADPNAPVTITEPADGHYLSGAATQVKGTAGANASVEIRDQWKVLTTVKADAKGNWSFWRHFGPDVTYDLIAKQTKTDGNTSESPVFKLAPKASQTSPVVITGPTDGYDPSGAGTLVTGTASPGAAVEVRSQWSVLKTVTADADGNWSFWRGFGPNVTYDLIAKQTRTNDTTSESAVFHLAPESTAVS